MASIRFDDDLSAQLASDVASCADVPSIRELFQSNKYFNLFENIKHLVARYQHLHIGNIKFAPNREILESIISLFGTFRAPVENTEIKIHCSHDGCSMEHLPFHNDDAILDSMPTFGVIQLENECPFKMPENGVVLIDDMVNYMRLYNQELLDRLLSHKVPMLASNVRKIIKDNRVHFVGGEEELRVKKSILHKEDGVYYSTFSLGRIKYHYYKTGEEQPLDEQKMIAEFLSLADKFRKTLYLSKNDLLIYNNKRIMHDRSESGVEIGIDGKTKSRSFYIAFAL